MQATRPLILAATLLTLMISACSQAPADLTAPTLEPQFGTTSDDRPVDVVVGPGGSVYGLYNYVTPDDGSNYFGDFTEVALLTRYNATGSVVWEREVFRLFCRNEYCNRYKARAMFADAANNTYVLVSSAYYSEPDGIGPDVSYYVYKFAPAGELIGTYTLGYFENFESSVSFKLTGDANGNIYVAAQGDVYEGVGNYLAKYTNTGSLVWKRSSSSALPYGTPTDLAVSGSGSIYVVGTKGFSRYSNTGNLVWNKTGSFEQVAVSGSNIYTRYRKDIRKYDGNGRQLWLRTQGGLNTLVPQNVDGDGSGNLYTSGKYDADARTSVVNMNAYVRKLSTSGSTLWTKTYGTPQYDDALGIATATGSEIYTIGETQGGLAHPNRGGPQNRDGYLRKQNSTGGLVWVR